MSLSFNAPLWLLLLLPLWLLAWRVALTGRVKLGPMRRWGCTLLRCLGILLLVLVLAQFRILQEEKGRTVILALDQSASGGEGNRERALRLMGQELPDRKEEDRVGLLVFGKEPRWDLIPEERDSLPQPQIKAGPLETNLELAYRFARSSVPPGTRSRLVLYTDGNETRGDILGALAREGDPRSMPVDIVPFLESSQPDAFVRRIETPGRVLPGEPFQVEVILGNTIPMDSVVRLSRNGALLAETTAKLTENGTARFGVQDVLDEPGFAFYQVTLSASLDRVPENNTGFGFVRAEGPKPILLISEQNTGHQLQNILTQAGLPTHIKTRAGLPEDPKRLFNYAAIVLDNLAAEHLTLDQMRALKVYVETLGGGLVALGGPDSFGLGGNFQSPLEETLPVTSDLRSKRQFPSLAMILCIDKSGSMADFGQTRISKIGIAREAAAQTVHFLGPQDNIGIITFDSAAKWLVKSTPARPADPIIQRIQTLQAGGGTDIYPALNMATKDLTDTDAALKHIILLSDGISGSANFKEVTKRMAANKITMTTISIGSDADRQTMEWLATSTGGRTYFTDNLQRVPRLFAKEAAIASRAYLMEETYNVKAKDWHPVLQGLSGSLPKIRGYVASSPRPLAKTILETSEGDPLLAWHQMGAGQAFAWLSDGHGRWNKAWVDSGIWSRLFTRTVRMAANLEGDGNISLQLTSDKGFLQVQAMRPASGNAGGSLVAEILPPKGESLTLPLHPAALGMDEARLPLQDPGIYLVSVHPESGQDPLAENQTSTAFYALHAQEEFRQPGTNRALLEQVAKETGGRILEDGKNLFAVSEGRFLSPEDKDSWWILIACLLLLADIAWRRIAWEPAWANAVSKKIQHRMNERRKRKALPPLVEPSAPRHPGPQPTPRRQVPSSGRQKTSAPPPGQGHTTDALLKKKKRKR